jgi:hypothetical protein
MSLVNNIFQTGERVLLACGHGDTFTVISGGCVGKTFVGRLDLQQVIDIESDLGPDPRMQQVVRVNPPSLDLQQNDLIRLGAQVLKVLKREDNIASITIDFWVEQQI